MSPKLLVFLSSLLMVFYFFILYQLPTLQKLQENDDKEFTSPEDFIIKKNLIPSEIQPRNKTFIEAYPSSPHGHPLDYLITNNTFYILGCKEIGQEKSCGFFVNDTLYTEEELPIIDFFLVNSSLYYIVEENQTLRLLGAEEKTNEIILRKYMENYELPFAFQTPKLQSYSFSNSPPKHSYTITSYTSETFLYLGNYKTKEIYVQLDLETISGKGSGTDIFSNPKLWESSETKEKITLLESIRRVFQENYFKLLSSLLFLVFLLHFIFASLSRAKKILFFTREEKITVKEHTTTIICSIFFFFLAIGVGVLSILGTLNLIFHWNLGPFIETIAIITSLFPLLPTLFSIFVLNSFFTLIQRTSTPFKTPQKIMFFLGPYLTLIFFFSSFFVPLSFLFAYSPEEAYASYFLEILLKFLAFIFIFWFPLLFYLKRKLPKENFVFFKEKMKNMPFSLLLAFSILSYLIFFGFTMSILTTITFQIYLFLLIVLPIFFEHVAFLKKASPEECLLLGVSLSQFMLVATLIFFPLYFVMLSKMLI
ncbi:MAG: hypothetical protein H6500_03475 [Candidatus Woesearchaeota archaeon]|nr:MAG: hypothetical protein H6500_03475 [Candidatus Woesearchaeota archaeon]